MPIYNIFQMTRKYLVTRGLFNAFAKYHYAFEAKKISSYGKSEEEIFYNMLFFTKHIPVQIF